MLCKKCGAEIAEGMNFCGVCGEKVEESSFCVCCGAKIEGGMSFCGVCGAKKGVPASERKPVPQPVPQPVRPAPTIHRPEDMTPAEYAAKASSYTVLMFVMGAFALLVSILSVIGGLTITGDMAENMAYTDRGYDAEAAQAFKMLYCGPIVFVGIPILAIVFIDYIILFVRHHGPMNTNLEIYERLRSARDAIDSLPFILMFGPTILVIGALFFTDENEVEINVPFIVVLFIFAVVGMVVSLYISFTMKPYEAGIKRLVPPEDLAEPEKKKKHGLFSFLFLTNDGNEGGNNNTASPAASASERSAPPPPAPAKVVTNADGKKVWVCRACGYENQTVDDTCASCGKYR